MAPRAGPAPEGRAGAGAKAPPDGLALVEMFLEAMTAERGISRNTCEAYACDLRQYLVHLGGHGLSALDAQTPDVQGFLGSLARSGIGTRTQARKLSALRQFHGFLMADGLREGDPTSIVDSPKQGRPLPKTLTVDEVDRLLEAAHAMPGWRGRRLGTMLEILYATGLRVSELVSLRRSSFSRDLRMVTVRGKGGKDRLVPLGEPARAALVAWLSELQRRHGGGGRGGGRGHAAAPSPWLFPTHSAAGHITRDRFAKLLRDLAVAARIDPRKVSPHVIRHAFATHLLANGADLVSIQRMLGHAELTTTEIYTHVTDHRLQSLVQDMHPLSKQRC